MIKSKKINIIVAVSVFFALIIAIVFIIVGNLKAKESDIEDAEYATKIFGTDIISIEIIANEDDWQEMLNNAINEQYIMVDVIINGTKFQNVGIRPKGNSSLAQVAASTSNRYSFRIKFDEYIKDQTCFGLDSFVLNNMIGDNTYMKEYISYELMKEAGVDTPYFGYANIKVNGKNWGLYLAVETYNESYEQRVFGDTLGMLYNVKSSGAAVGDDMMQMPEDNFMQPPGEQQNNNPLPPREGEGNIDRNFNRGRTSLGGSLEYIDDDSENYSDIFDNVVGKGTESDFQRVIKALKALASGENLETYFNVDQILRYLAAHTIVVNLDSYSSSMAQNYFIYERDGQITILPWDYNLSWGGFQSVSASYVINFPIDTPVSDVEMVSRPLIEKLLTNSEYLNQYHLYLQFLIDNYFNGGKFENKINTLDAMISEYVKNDATAFCTYEQYKTAISVFTILGNLRAESVQGQLDGTIPSTTIEQSLNTSKLITAENLNINDLGSMNNGQEQNVLPGDHFGGIGNGAPNNTTPNFADETTTINQKPIINSVYFVGGLSFILIIAIVFVAKFKVKY